MILSLICTICMIANHEVKTVPYVDVNRYMGTWYEIASYPQWFEKGMTDVCAVYTLKKDYVEVLNSGIKDGKRKEAKGKAKVVKDSGNAKLKVTFFWPFYGEYWIVDLADDYSWVVVSNSKRSTLWILAREKTMPSELYDSICDRLKADGFNLEKLVVHNS